MFRQVWRRALVWALVFGGTAASSALAYASSYPDEASRHQAALATSSDAGLAILLGPVGDIETVGGYMVYKCFVFLTTIGAIWGLLMATRLLRGEEDSGRWQLVLSGGTRATRATAATLAGLAGAVVVLFVGTTAIVAIGGRDPKLAFPFADTVLYGVSLVVAPAVFIAVGAVTSQLGRTRRVATGLGMAVFAVTTVLRMIADSGSATRWMLWLTPFGWIERMRPYTAADWRPVGLAAVAVVVLGFVAVRLAGTRDVGAGVIATSEVSELRPFGLRSTTGLVVRGEAGVLIAWIIGVSAGTFAFGIVAKVVSDALPDSSLDTFEKLGLSGTIVAQYFGVAFLLVATIVALLPVGQIAAAAEDEGEGRTALVLALPVQRARVLAGRLVLAAAAVVVAAALAGLAGWLGAATQDVDSGFASMVGAGLNVAPTALVVLGVGAVILAVAPRAAAPAMYAVVIGSLVIDLLASLVDGTKWLEHLSLFHYMALAPATDVDAATVAITLTVALALCALATVLFSRRDLASR